MRAYVMRKDLPSRPTSPSPSSFSLSFWERAFWGRRIGAGRANQCAAAPSAPRPVWARTYCASNRSDSANPCGLWSITETT